MTLGVADPQGNLLDDMSASATRRSPSTRSTWSCTASVSVSSPTALRRPVLRRRTALGPSLDRRGGDGAAAPGGLSDREAAERYASTPAGATRRVSAATTLEDGRLFPHGPRRHPRALRHFKTPDRVFEIALDAAKEAGLVGRKRVLDSTPLYDTVATMDTITLIRSAIRNLLKLADDVLEPSCARSFGAGTTTPAPRSPRSTGTTKRPKPS